MATESDSGGATDRHVSGILVTSTAATLEECRREVEALPGVEVYFLYPESGRLIAVQETATAKEQEAGLRRIQALPTVRMAALVEHRIDDEAAWGTEESA